MSYDLWKSTNPADEWSGPEPEPKEEEPVWEFYSGPFACLESSIAAVRWLDDSFAGRFWKFGVWPDPNSAKWLIKRTAR